MPAYVNVQCFKKYEEETFGCLLEIFGRALLDLGFDEYYLKSYVENVRWSLSNNGFMYEGCNMPSKNIKVDENYFAIRPLIGGFTSEGCEGLLEDSWVNFEFLFAEDEIIKDFNTGELYDCAKKIIWTACNILSKYFPDTVVFLTDEATDTLPWDALMGLNKDKYSFDLVIAPNNYLEIYRCIPDGFKIIELDNKIYIARMSVWNNEPWI